MLRDDVDAEPVAARPKRSGPLGGVGIDRPNWASRYRRVAYFLAARLSLALLTKPDGVAVFWPAAGIASGTLIALGPRARLPVVLGVVAATIVANLLGDRNFAAGVIFALCNAGEALLVAGLIQRTFGRAVQARKLAERRRLLCRGGDRSGDLGNRGNGRVFAVLQLGRAGSDHLAELVRL